MKILNMLLLLGLTGCASTNELMPEADVDNDAAAAALVDFSIRKSMGLRRPAQTFDFYFKHCSVAGADELGVGINVWECNQPFY